MAYSQGAHGGFVGRHNPRLTSQQAVIKIFILKSNKTTIFHEKDGHEGLLQNSWSLQVRIP
jgi:hypothetical protein